MSKILIYSAIFAPSILIGLGIAIYLFQEKMIFHPEKLSDKYQFIFDGFFEERTYQTSDGNGLSALLFKAKNSKGVVFYHHGNTGSLNWWGKRAVDFTARGYDVLMYDYRGYGKSEGSIKNEKMLYEDATVIYKALLLEYEASKIIVYGVSLGSGIASYIALNGNPSQLILEAPYYNFYDVAKLHYPYLPNALLLHYQFKTNLFLPKIESEIYLFHGTEDETIPYNSSVRLAGLSNHIHLIAIKNGSHNNLNSFDVYHQKMNEILS